MSQLERLKYFITGEWLKGPLDCARTRMLLPAAYDNKLDKWDKAALAEHIAICPDCAADDARLKELKTALAEVHGAIWPADIAQKLSAALTSSRRARIASMPRRSIIVRRQYLFRRTTDLLLISFGALLVIGMINYDVFKQLGPQTTSPGASQSGSTIPKPPIDIPDENTATGGGIDEWTGEDRTDEKVTPLFAVTGKNYTKDDVEDVRATEFMLAFSQDYAPSDIPSMRQIMMDSLVQQAQDAGQDGTALRQNLDKVIKGLGGSALPAYVEKARYNNRDMWLLVIVSWPNDKLKVSEFVINAADNRLVHNQ